MCLEIKKGSRFNIAFNGIKCYKILRDNKTPYRNFQLSQKIIDGKVDLTAKGVFALQDNFNGTAVEITSGAIHTYAHLSDACDDAKWLRFRTGSDKYSIYECVIPIGTKYYEGTTDVLTLNHRGSPTGFTRAVAYASQKIRFVKKVKDLNDEIRIW